MNNPFDLILKNRPLNDVLTSATESSKFELESAANQLRSKDVSKIAEYSIKICNTATVHSDLVCGGILELVAIGSCEEKHPEIYDEVVTEIGISRTQSYRCRAVWRSCGKELFENPELIPAFSSESLKLLSEGESTPEARAAAMEMAKNGQAVTIKVAKQLRSEHAVKKADEPTKVSKTKSGTVKRGESIWKFTGRVVDIVLTPTRRTNIADVAAVVRDLQAAIDQLLKSESDQSAA